MPGPQVRQEVSAIVQDCPLYLVKNPLQLYQVRKYVGSVRHCSRLSATSSKIRCNCARSASTPGSVRHCSRLSALARKESSANVTGPQVRVSAIVQDCPLYLVKNPLQLYQVRKYVRKCPPLFKTVRHLVKNPLQLYQVREYECPPLFKIVLYPLKKSAAIVPGPQVRQEVSAIVHACPSRVRHCSC